MPLHASARRTLLLQPRERRPRTGRRPETSAPPCARDPAHAGDAPVANARSCTTDRARCALYAARRPRKANRWPPISVYVIVMSVGRPRGIPCPICWRLFFKASLPFHFKACAVRNPFSDPQCPRCGRRVGCVNGHRPCSRPCGLDAHPLPKSAMQLELHLRECAGPRPRPYITTRAGEKAAEPLAAPLADGRVPCRHCGRCFAHDRVATHQCICARSSSARPTFDSAAQRLDWVATETPHKRLTRVAARPPTSPMSLRKPRPARTMTAHAGRRAEGAEVARRERRLLRPACAVSVPASPSGFARPNASLPFVRAGGFRCGTPSPRAPAARPSTAYGRDPLRHSLWNGRRPTAGAILPTNEPSAGNPLAGSRFRRR